MLNTHKLIVAAAIAVAATSAHAGSITADYSFTLFGGVTFNANLPGHVGSKSVNTALMHGERTDLPAGVGVDSNVPKKFTAFCVEVGETINNGSQTHANVLPLLGATTAPGGISGPVLFDATRTKNLELLWGSYRASVVDVKSAAAFQLAEWEIAFDDDLTLTDNTQKLWVDDVSSGLYAKSEAWLSAIKNGNATSKQSLYLLQTQGVQDLVTPVPEPGTIAAIGIGAAGLLRRRARRN